jgi:proline dehydrogenase
VKKARKIIKPFIHKAVSIASKSYIAGETLEAAITTAGKLYANGYPVTLAYWDGADDNPTAVIERYLAAIRRFEALASGGYLSIKAPAFAFDPGLYATLAVEARSVGIPLHLDSLAHETTDKTFDLIENHTPHSCAGIGISLPGRWRRSLVDTERVIEHGLIPRIVKGQWVDPGGDVDPAEGFFSVTERLAGRVPLVRIATHDTGLAVRTIDLLTRNNTAVELELLYGLPMSGIVRTFAERNIPIRIYIPYGEAWLPYVMSSLGENPRMIWWLARDFMQGLYQGNARFPARRTGQG